MIALAVVTDGRECIRNTIASARANLIGPISHQVIYDDTGDELHRARLRKQFPDFTVIGQHRRQGFAGAVRTLWSYLEDRPERFIFHLEDDFTFNRPVPLPMMIYLLDTYPELAQVALRRQPWNDAEKLAGGIVEQHPEDYTEHDELGVIWLQHRRFFTTNPSLYRTTLRQVGWPDGSESEGRFTRRCLERGLEFAYLGGRDESPWVHHIGTVRAGMEY